MHAKTILLALAFSAAAWAPAALAANEGEVRGGIVVNTTIVNGPVATTASGFKAKALTSIGVIQGVRVNGSLTQTTVVGSSATTASSAFSKAETEIGAVEDSTVNGAVSRVIVVDEAVTRARNFGATATTKVGVAKGASDVGSKTVHVGRVYTATSLPFEDVSTCIAVEGRAAKEC